MTRDELAREIAHTSGQPESTERILTALHHVHLPKLADERAIQYEADEGVVSLTARAERFLECLDSIENRPL